MQIEKRYIFQAHAVGVSAHFRRPSDNICWIQGATALPATGGFGKSEVGPQCCQDGNSEELISFESVCAQVSGDFADSEKAVAQTRGENPDDLLPVRTTASALITGLSVFKRLRIERLSAHLMSEDSREGQPSFSSKEQQPFVGVSVDGFPVNVEVDDLFSDLTTFQALQDRYEDDEDFREENKERFEHNGEEHSILHPHRIPQYNGVIATTIVRRLSWVDNACPRARIEGNRIVLENFGTIFFGEMFAGEKFRRFTLVRLKLGSDQGGDGSIGDVRPSGDGWPSG